MTVHVSDQGVFGLTTGCPLPIPEDCGVLSLDCSGSEGDVSMIGGKGRLSRSVGVGEADEVGLDPSDSEPRRVGFIALVVQNP